MRQKPLHRSSRQYNSEIIQSGFNRVDMPSHTLQDYMALHGFIDVAEAREHLRESVDLARRTQIVRAHQKGSETELHLDPGTFKTVNKSVKLSVSTVNPQRQVVNPSKQISTLDNIRPRTPAQLKSLADQRLSRTCKGCGGHLDSKTVGCSACYSRHYERQNRPGQKRKKQAT